MLIELAIYWPVWLVEWLALIGRAALPHGRHKGSRRSCPEPHAVKFSGGVGGTTFQLPFMLISL
jgi:hypothetical protein